MEAAFANYHTYPKKLADQCVLNQVLRDDVTFVSAAYNINDPDWWPDGATAFAVHTRDMREVDNGERPARNFDQVTCADPAETPLRGLDSTHPAAPAGEHLMELHAIASDYAGGRALEYSTAPGQTTLALALAGLDLTSCADDDRSHYWRIPLLARHDLQARVLRQDPLVELEQLGQFDLMLWSDDQTNHIAAELELFWEAKLAPAGPLIVFPADRLEVNSLANRLQPETSLVTEDHIGRQMAYFRKPARPSPHHRAILV